MSETNERRRTPPRQLAVDAYREGQAKRENAFQRKFSHFREEQAICGRLASTTRAPRGANLEGYFIDCLQQGATDHALRVTETADGTIAFYIHPEGVAGTTMDFTVIGNVLATIDAAIPIEGPELPEETTTAPPLPVDEIERYDATAKGAEDLRLAQRAALSNMKPGESAILWTMIAGNVVRRRMTMEPHGDFSYIADGMTEIVPAADAFETFDACRRDAIRREEKIVLEATFRIEDLTRLGRDVAADGAS